MSAKGPDLAPGEAQAVIEYVINYAKQMKSRKITIDLNLLSPLFFGCPDPKFHMNRIRWNMAKEFLEAKIANKCLATKYEFTLDSSIDIDETPTETIAPLKKNKETNPIMQEFKTSTTFFGQFIPPKWFPDLIYALQKGKKPIITGPHGCGKTRILEEAFRFMGRKIRRISLSTVLDPSELIGTREVINDNGVPVTKFVGGALTTAMQEGAGIILDEYDLCPPTTLTFLNTLIEHGVEIALQTEIGEINFRPHPNTLIAGAGNTRGRGDSTGNYAGASMHNKSSLDRFRPKFPHDYDMAMEKQVIAPYVPADVLKVLYNDDPDPNKKGIIPLIRHAINDPANPLQDTLSFRTILSIAEMWEGYKWHKNMFYFCQDFEEENIEAVSQIIKNRLGAEFAPSQNDSESSAIDYIPHMELRIKAKFPKFFDI